MVADVIPIRVKAELRQSFYYSTSDWTVGGANYVGAILTDSVCK